MEKTKASVLVNNIYQMWFGSNKKKGLRRGAAKAKAIVTMMTTSNGGNPMSKQE
jgi:hypothetical protein